MRLPATLHLKSGQTARSVLLIALLSTLLLLSGCATMTDYEAGQEQRGDLLVTLEPGQVLEQTLLTRREGLAAIQVWLSLPEAAGKGDLAYQLSRTDTDEILATGILSAAVLPGASPLTLAIAAPRLPAGSYCTLRLSAENLRVQVFGRVEEVYPTGELRLDDRLQTGDMAFRLQYAYGFRAALQDVEQALAGSWLALPLLLAFWLPGRLVLAWLEPRLPRLDWGERTAYAVGLSLALIPLALLWTSAAGLHWNTLGAWTVCLGLAGGYAWQRRAAWKDWLSARRWQAFRLQPAALGLAAVFLLAGGVRLAMVRDLAAPAWVDSVHHALLSRLTLEQGGFPADYAPYLPGETASYHPGFHGLAALLVWLSGLELSHGLQLAGQTLNALSVFAAYLFAGTVTHRKGVALGAALVAGLLTPMPAYYASWGRYTQLAGLLVFPAALGLLLRLRQEAFQGRFQPRLLLGCAMALAGLLLLHYRVLVFTLSCLLAVEITSLARVAGQRFQRGSRVAWQAGESGWISRAAGSLSYLSAGLVAIWLSLPWWLDTLPPLLATAQRLSPSQTALFHDFSWNYLTAAGGRLSLWLAAAGWLLAACQRKRWTLLLPLWVGILFGLANLGAYRLPGSGWINNTSVEILLFLPLGVLCGHLFEQIYNLGSKLSPPSLRPWLTALAWLSGFGLAAWGGQRLLPLVNPTTVLFREADRPALAWITENTPSQAGFLINPFSWGYGTYAGNDGGFWIAPLAGRRTIPPPVIFALDASPEQFTEVNDISRRALQAAQDPAALHALMRENGLDYLYIGARGGAFSLSRLSASPLFRLRYQNGGTAVFEIIR